MEDMRDKVQAEYHVLELQPEGPLSDADSNASFHVSYCKEELERFKLHSGKDVRYTLGLKKRLILVGPLDEEVYHLGFGDQQWKVTKSSLVVAPGNKRGSLYMVEVHPEGIGVIINCSGSAAAWFGEAEESFLHNVSEDKENAEAAAQMKCDTAFGIRRVTRLSEAEISHLWIRFMEPENDSIVAEHGLSSKITQSPGGSSDTSEGSANNESFEDSGRSYEEYSKDGASSKEGGSETPHVRRSIRESRAPVRYSLSANYLLLTYNGELESYSKALSSKESVQWKKAIIKEMVSLEKNQMCFLVRISAGKKASQRLWMFKVKEEQNGSKMYKARLEPSYVGALNDTSTQQKGKGFQLAGQEENLECRLNEIMYRLIQAPRLRYLKFDSFMQKDKAPTWQSSTSLSSSFPDVHQVGDEREVEVLCSFNSPSSELITDDYQREMAQPQVNPDSAAAQIILRWDSTASEDARVRMIFEGDRDEIDRYLHAVDQIQRSMDNATLSEDESKKVNNTIQIAMARLEDEFRNILITNSTPIETESLTDSISSNPLTPRTSSCHSPDNNERNNKRDIEAVARISSASFTERKTFASCRSMNSIREQDLIPQESVSNLRCIAKRMITAGYFRECVQVYGSVRKSVVDGSFKKLGVEKLSIGDIQRLEWDSLNAKIGRWIRAAKVCIRVFISRRSPEKLFKILDLHDSLLDLLSDIDNVFDSKPAESIRVQSTEILSRLAEATRGMLSEFENAVLREPSRVPVPGGTIHPLTRNTGDSPTGPEIDFSEHEEQSPLALHLIWIIAILQFNLEGKSKHYKDNSLAYLFIMNNVHYIVQKIKGSQELREMIGDQYLRTLTRIFRQAATNHQRATWIGVLHCLRDQGLHSTGSFASGVSKSALRERFKSFNAIFDEVHRTQALWLVPDEQLREELRISILEKLIPAYRSFLGRFRNHISDNYIKYTVEDLENAVLQDLFEGYAVSQHSRRRSQ
nr:exocyst complex component EXO70A1-like [Tanacetum cinerariifolium]